MRDLPGPGIKSMYPALASGFLTTAPRGKPLHWFSTQLMNRRDLKVTKTWKDLFLWKIEKLDLENEPKGLINLHSQLVTFQYIDVSRICEGHWHEINTLPLIPTSRGFLFRFLFPAALHSCQQSQPFPEVFYQWKEPNGNSYQALEFPDAHRTFIIIYNTNLGSPHSS